MNYNNDYNDEYNDEYDNNYNNQNYNRKVNNNQEKIVKVLLIVVIFILLFLCGKKVYDTWGNDGTDGTIVSTDGSTEVDPGDVIIEEDPPYTEPVYTDITYTVPVYTEPSYTSPVYTPPQKVDFLAYKDVLKTKSLTYLYTTYDENASNYEKKTPVVANTYLYSIIKTSNGYYAVTNNGETGYIKASDVKSYRDVLDNEYNVTSFDIKYYQIAYVKSSTSLKKNYGDGDTITTLSKNDQVTIWGYNNNYYLITDDKDNLGFVPQSSLSNNKITSTGGGGGGGTNPGDPTEVTGSGKATKVVVDLSEQKMYVYNGSSLLMKSSVVTGKDNTPTDKGTFKILKIYKDAKVSGAKVDYWMPFHCRDMVKIYGCEGFHDAYWQKDWSSSAYHKNGSAGCVHVKTADIKRLAGMVKVGTTVVVQK